MSNYTAESSVFVRSNAFDELRPSMRDVIRARNNHSESGPMCRVYLCQGRSANSTGYCPEHVSPLRTGKAPYTQGSTPVVYRCGSMNYEEIVNAVDPDTVD